MLTQKKSACPLPAFDGQRLRQIRLTRDLTARDLAKKANMNVRNVWRLEANARPNVRAVTLARLTLALEINIDYLLGLTDETKRYPLAGSSSENIR